MLGTNISTFYVKIHKKFFMYGEKMKKTMKDVSQVKAIEEGVVIEVVDESADTDKIKEVVENCQTGKCDCMSEETKAKVTFMDFRIENGKPVIEIKGDVSEEEIKEAVNRSKKEL